MANPNIVNVSDIRGKTNVANLSSTNTTNILSNPSGSNKVFKINTIIISNANTVAGLATGITVELYSQANATGTNTEIASTVTVPANASIVILDKNSSIYLEEDKSIGLRALVANRLKGIISYEEIS